MELQKFISDTLVQITQGVLDAQKELKDTGCLINPDGYKMGTSEVQITNDSEYRAVQNVKTNVVLSIEEGTDSKSKIGVAKIIQAGVSSDESSKKSQMTTLEFEIPVALPIAKI